MTRLLFLFSLTIVLGLTSLHAQQRSQPVPANGACVVAPDKRWTKQEKWVWSRACIGEAADFNNEPGYGGTIDPRQPAGLPESRTLRSSFIEAILLRPEYSKVLTRRGVRILGARFTEPLDLEYAELLHSLQLDECLFDVGVKLNAVRSTFRISLARSKIRGPLEMQELRASSVDMNNAEIENITLQDAQISGTVDLVGSKISGTAEMIRIRVDAGLFMRDNSEFVDVTLADSHVGTVDLSKARVSGTLDLTRIVIDGDLDMSNHGRFARVSLDSAKVGANIKLSGAEVSGSLSMNDLRVGANVSMIENAKFSDISFRGAQIAGDLDLSSSEVTGTMEMSPLHIGSRMFLVDHGKYGEINMVGARIARLIDMSNSIFEGKLNMSGVQVGDHLFMRENGSFAEVSLDSANVGKDLDLNGTFGSLDGFNVEVGQNVFISGSFSGTVDLNLARIKGDVYLTADSDIVDLSGAQIGRDLSISSNQLNKLILRDASADRIPRLGDRWASQLDLDGFTYRRAPDAANFEKWFAKLNKYSAQPYGQLALVVQNQGDPDLARAIRYAGKEKERDASEGWSSVWSAILDALIGYGYHVERALKWVFVFVAFGTIFLSFSQQSEWNSLSSLRSKVVYSVDLLLPIIRLREKNYQITLDGWLGYYFYVHKIMGYVLASFLIAGLSGLAK